MATGRIDRLYIQDEFNRDRISLIDVIRGSSLNDIRIRICIPRELVKTITFSDGFEAYDRRTQYVKLTVDDKRFCGFAKYINNKYKLQGV